MTTGHQLIKMKGVILRIVVRLAIMMFGLKPAVMTERQERQLLEVAEMSHNDGQD